jgi:hypothetical protein
MYECAVGQVYSLCSIDTVTYELGIDSGASAARWGTDEDRPPFVVRARVYWYCYVHEAIKTGLKGGRLVMDEDDLEQFQASADGSHKMLIPSHNSFDAVARYATAPIRLAQACRLIHRALTGPKARRNERVNGEHLKSAWEALEACFEEFQEFRVDEADMESGILKKRDIERFCDGWQCFLFECHSVIREALSDRITQLEQVVETGRLQAIAPETDTVRIASADNLLALRRLHAIAESKCYTLAKLMIIIVKRNLGSRFFAYDASLVRGQSSFLLSLHDLEVLTVRLGLQMASTTRALFWQSTAAVRQTCEFCPIGVLPVASHQIELTMSTIAFSNACLTAFDEMRWAFSKTYERTEKIKSLWASSLDGRDMDSGSRSAVSASLPYPLRPDASHARPHDRPPAMSSTLQRMPSFDSDSFSPTQSDESPPVDLATR